MALFPEGTNGAVQNLANKGIKKAVNYGSKYLNNKLNYGLNYARSFIRQYDILGIMPEQWTILDEEREKVFGFDTFQSLNSKNENKVTQMPVEGGSFVDYNIVETPREITCIISKHGFAPDLMKDILLTCSIRFLFLALKIIITTTKIITTTSKMILIIITATNALSSSLESSSLSSLSLLSISSA